MGSNNPVVPDPVLGLPLPLRHPGILSRRVAMARDAVAPAFRPWLVDLVPLLIVLLIAAHVVALGYWIYRLATETDGSKQPTRSKKH